MSNHLEPLEVVLNGQPHAIPQNCTLLALVRSLGLDPARVAVELDGEIVKRESWDKTALKAGSRLELVHFVGGG